MLEETFLPQTLNKDLQDVLGDIVNRMEIKSDFSIFNPDYKPLQIPAEARENFDKMPPEIQQKYLSSQRTDECYYGTIC